MKPETMLKLAKMLVKKICDNVKELNAPINDPMISSNLIEIALDDLKSLQDVLESLKDYYNELVKKDWEGKDEG